MEYTLEDSFHIDDGSLDTVSAAQAFILGVEWTMVRQILRVDSAPIVALPIHEENLSRLRALLDKFGYSGDFRHVSPGWYAMTARKEDG